MSMDAAAMSPAEIATEKYNKLGLPEIPKKVDIQDIYQAKKDNACQKCADCGKINMIATARILAAEDSACNWRHQHDIISAKMDQVPRWIRWIFSAL